MIPYSALPARGRSLSCERIRWAFMTLALSVSVCGLSSVTPAPVYAQPTLNAPSSDSQPASEEDLMSEELTRGVVHEAYAQPVVFNPEPGDVIREAPPEAIEELPPEEKPEGENVEWIPGYWAWDDDDNHYVWVSGLWRMIPPGLDWVPGYWTEVQGGYQWVSGFWRGEQTEDVEYLPQPPQSLERGPAVSPPSEDHVWVPGTWTWIDTRYAWRPGHWVVCRPGWIWVPARYVWTPYGFIYVDGYWDYALPRRGVLYAPIWFPRGYVAGHRYRYSPRVVIDVNVFSTHIFCRPTRNVYCFGDFYAARYFERGIYPSYAYHMSRYGYDPVFAYHRWEHVRHEPNWHDRMRADYRYRRDHEDARPPRTYVATQQLIARGDSRDVHSLVIATSLTTMAKRPEVGFKVESLTRERRGEMQTEMHRWSEIQERRREVEVKQARLNVDGLREPAKGRPDPREIGAIGGRGDNLRDPRETGDERVRDPRVREPNGKGRVIIPGQELPAGAEAAVLRDQATARKVKLFAESTKGRPTVGDRPLGDAKPGDVKPGEPAVIVGKPADSPAGVAGLKPGELPKTSLTRPPRKVAAEFTPPPRPDVPKAELRRTDVVRPETGRTTVGRPDITRPEIGRPEVGRPDTTRIETRDSEARGTETRNNDTRRNETRRTEVPRPEIRKVDPVRPAAPKVELPKVDLPKVDLPRTGVPRSESPRKETPRVEPPRPEIRKAEPAKRAADEPRGRINTNTAIDEARKANERRVEDLQRQLRERQPATGGQPANNSPPRAATPRTNPSTPRPVTTPRMERENRANRDRQENKKPGNDR